MAVTTHTILPGYSSMLPCCNINKGMLGQVETRPDSHLNVCHVVIYFMPKQGLMHANPRLVYLDTTNKNVKGSSETWPMKMIVM